MQIINPGPSGDYHVHSINYSDGLNTIDELVHWAGIFGLDEIAITDHSQAMLDKKGLAKKNFRSIVQGRRWQNVHGNNVKVIFGIEGDILNEHGDICDEIQGKNSDFLVLSLHKDIYSGDFTKVTEAYCNAISRNSAIDRLDSKIKVLGHPCIKAPYQRYLDIETVASVANQFGVPLELNCVNLVSGKTDLEQLKKMLGLADRIYVNSDAHTLYELKTARDAGFELLRDEGYLK